MALVDDIRELTDEVKALNRTGETYKQQLQKHDQQINGEQGLFKAIDKLTTRVEGLTTAAYRLGGAVVFGAISFGFSVLYLIH